MKEGWEIKKWQEVLEIRSGRNQKAVLNPNGKYPILGSAGKVMGYADDYLCDKGTTIIGRKGTIDNPLYIESKFWNVDTAFGLIAGENLNKQYLYYFCRSFNFKALDKGTTLPSLVKKDLVKIEIPLPPIKQQQQIVAILDKAFTAIDKVKANAAQNLLNAKELFESYLQNMFTNKGEDWEEKRLDEVCEITSKLIDPEGSQYQDLIHIGAGNIVSEKGTLINLKTAKEENLISGKFLFDESMVLYSKIRPYLMKIIKCEFKGLCSADIYPLVPFKDKMTQSFLYHLLSSNHFTEYAIEGSQRAGMPKVNRKHLFNFVFHCPPIQEQQKIVKKLDALQAQTKKLEAIYQQKIVDLEELKKAILQKAFSGELTQKELV